MHRNSPLYHFSPHNLTLSAWILSFCVLFRSHINYSRSRSTTHMHTLHVINLQAPSGSLAKCTPPLPHFENLRSLLEEEKEKKSYGYLTAASFHFSYWQLLLAGYILSLADRFPLYCNFQLTSTPRILWLPKFYVCLDYLLYFIRSHKVFINESNLMIRALFDQRGIDFTHDTKAFYSPIP